MNNKKLRNLPSVSDILDSINAIQYNLPYHLILKKIRQSISEFRNEIMNGNELTVTDLIPKIKNELEKLNSSSLQSVINGTGIILHTGLGRAPISEEILNNSFEKLSGYINIELDLNNGNRGERANHINLLLDGLTGSKESVVVNNNASAVLLTLNTFGEKKEVIVSRGEQVEIGGSFRIPDVINKAGCHLVEVGTTNRTHLKDYQNAITKQTGLLLVAHTSNYIVKGFTKSVEIEELVLLAKKRKIPLIIDLGSGALAELQKLGLPFEPVVQFYIKAGVDAVTFSGDKLLGGPQCGIICGKQGVIKKIRNNALYRALRCDKIIYTILEETLRTYYNSTIIKSENLTWTLFQRKMIDLEEIGNFILSNLSSKILKNSGLKLINSIVEAGSGSLPTQNIESRALSFKSKLFKPKQIHLKFLSQKPAILGYIHNNQFNIDLKAVLKNQQDYLLKSITEIFS